MILRIPDRRRPTTRRWLLVASAIALVVLLALGGGAGRASAAPSDYSGTFYLSSTASAQVTGSYQLVQTAPSPSSTATQNRIATSTTGYQEFQAGVKPVLSTSNTPAPVASPSTTPDNKGWVVDGTAGLSFAAGSWTFTNTVTQNYSCSPCTAPSAQIVVGMWKVTVTAGHATTTPTLLVDPTCTSAPCSSGAAPGGAAAGTGNFITASGSATVSLNVSVPGFSLGTNEHLYVQYWRWQTVAMPLTSGAANRLATLGNNDGVAKITHPSVNAFPTASLGSVGVRVNAPSLAATYADSDSDSGTVTQQLCTDSLCSSVAATGTSGSLASGATYTWSPAGLTSGTTYYWRAQSQDSYGNVSDWSATQSFVFDNTPPALPTLSSPSSGARVNSSQLTAVYANTDVGDSGTLDLQLCTSSSCATVVASSTSSSLTNGTAANWTPSVTDGAYWWRARSSDVAGNQSAWTAARSFTLDTTAPSVTSGTTGALLTAAPALTATFADPDSGDSGSIAIQLCADSGCSSILQTGTGSPWTPSGLSSGTYYWRTRATDTAGNQSAWSTVQSFALDVTAPTAGPAATAARVRTAPSLAASFTDPEAADTGTITLQLCTTSSCGTVLQSSTSAALANGATSTWTPTSLADGTYWWRARATDTAGNQSAWSTTASFVVDTVAPAVSPAAPSARTRVAPLLRVRLAPPDDPGDSGRALFELCGDAACTQVITTGWSMALSGGGSVSWQAPPLADGLYWWQALGEDAIGNQSPWVAGSPFVIDTTTPAAPEPVGPTDGARVNHALLGGVAVGANRGRLDFQLCSDADCSDVVETGTSADFGVTGRATWTPSVADGTYHWRVRAEDDAGNASAWSPTMSLTLDTTPPPQPQAAAATIDRTTLTLRWQPPQQGERPARYVLIVDGRAVRALPGSTLALRIQLKQNDRRSFAIAAVDRVGNVGRAVPLFGMPGAALKHVKSGSPRP